METGITEKASPIREAVSAKFSKRAGRNSAPESSPARKKKKRRRLIIIIASLIVVLLAVFLIFARHAASSVLTVAVDDTTVLTYTDFSNSISATGTVASADSTFVYSTLSYAVQSVEVEVGDYVEQDQLLAKLDDQNIIDQIESQQASMSDANTASAQSIKSAQDNYDQYKYTLENGLNSSINTAQSQADNAYDNYIQAVNAYQRYRDSLDAGENSALLNQEAALRSAQSARDAAEDAYDAADDAADDAEDDWQAARETLADLKAERESVLANDPEADVTDLDAQIAAAENEAAARKSAYDAARSKLDSAERSLDNAEDSYDTAEAQYNAAVTSVDNALADYATAVDSAYQSYQAALTNLEAARLAADNQLKSYADSLSNAKTNADKASSQVSLRQLRVDLDSTDITAPVSGTVTAVYAEVGGSGSGLLFVIEDVDDLIIETAVKEYDVGSVAVGMPVSIKSDATGSEIYEGSVQSIAPTANKTAQGITDTSGEVEFATEVKVTSQNTRLRIGMSVRLNYIIEQQASALAVPYDAVYTNTAGEDCILILEQQPAGTYLISELPVTTGAENDLDIVISGDGVSEGLQVINEPDNYKLLIGKEVALTESAPPAMTPFPGV